MSSPDGLAAGATKAPSLARHADFNKLWAGQSVSMVGSQITGLALPLTGALVLHASAWQMGLLTAMSSVPWLLFSLIVGVWVDRMRRRPVMILADVGRALLVGLVPLAAVLGFLDMGVLYVAALGVGFLTVFFDLADQAYLPALVGRENLVEGNGKMQLSQSVALLIGPGLAGILVQLLTAPVALVLDAVSFVVSAVSVVRIRTPEAAPERRTSRMGHDIVEGLRLVFGQPLLRALVGFAGTSNFAFNMMFAILILYVTDVLGLSALEIGLVLSIGALGGVAGALQVKGISQRLGVGRTLMVVALLDGIGMILVPAASGSHWARFAVLTAAAFVAVLSSAASNTLAVSMRQAVTPDRLLGRMTATVRFVIWGLTPLAALTGGALGQWLGLRATLAVAAGLSFLQLAWLFFSPLRGMRDQPEPLALEAERAVGG